MQGWYKAIISDHHPVPIGGDGDQAHAGQVMTKATALGTAPSLQQEGLFTKPSKGPQESFT